MGNLQELQTIDQNGQIVEYQFSNVLNPEGANEIAKTIKHYTERNGLMENIKGKPYAKVEAWQYAGLLLGLFPIVTEKRNLCTDEEFKYECTVEIRNDKGEVKGRGFALCSNLERTKRHFEEYAVLSMSQTRATAKAFRLLLGWMFQLAGYEGVAAEEMEQENPNIKPQGPTSDAILKEYTKFALEAVICCSTAGQVEDLVNIAPTLKETSAKFIDTARGMYKQLANVTE